VVFFAGGIGHPYFSTDMGTVLRAIEIEADMILSARAVDGVYDADPKIDKNAKKYDTIPIREVVDRQLGVMDLAAAVLCMENKMPMTIFGLNEEDSIINTVKGNSNGTLSTVRNDGYRLPRQSFRNEIKEDIGNGCKGKNI